MSREKNIKNARQFDRLAKKYFDECEKKNKPVKLTRLILALGLSSRQSLARYEKLAEFSDSVKKAKLRCEAEYEDKLDGPNPSGAIFALKNFGWSDKQDVEVRQAEAVTFKWQD